LKKPTVKEIIIVEGRYDKNTLSQIVDAVIIDVGGFGIYHDAEKLRYIRKLAEKCGAVILTDADGAGFQIRRRISDALAGLNVKHAYIPDIIGREKRKTMPTRSGLLGVEGMSRDILIEALIRSGACIDSKECESARKQDGEEITASDLYELGLSGTPGAAAHRASLCHSLGLPRNIGTNALLRALNLIINKSQLKEIAESAERQAILS